MVCVLGGSLCRNSNFPGQAILSKIVAGSCRLIFHAVDGTTTKAGAVSDTSSFLFDRPHAREPSCGIPGGTLPALISIW